MPCSELALPGPGHQPDGDGMPERTAGPEDRTPRSQCRNASLGGAHRPGSVRHALRPSASRRLTARGSSMSGRGQGSTLASLPSAGKAAQHSAVHVAEEFEMPVQVSLLGARRPPRGDIQAQWNRPCSPRVLRWLHDRPDLIRDDAAVKWLHHLQMARIDAERPDHDGPLGRIFDGAPARDERLYRARDVRQERLGVIVVQGCILDGWTTGNRAAQLDGVLGDAQEVGARSGIAGFHRKVMRDILEAHIIRAQIHRPDPPAAVSLDPPAAAAVRPGNGQCAPERREEEA